MHSHARTLFTAVAFSLLAAPAIAQQPTSSQQPAGLMGELVKDVTDVQGKLIALARELPSPALEWRPGDGVRSTGEVLLHIAADNYLLPIGVGVPAPASTGISIGDFSTLTTFETQRLSREAMIASLDTSFAHLVAAMSATTPARLDETITFFGQEMTVLQLWVLTTGHLHEHLGQLIAYTRTNGIAPPWSRPAQ
ncbi:MAG: DinB family protein [Gemmatimonadaceae bacterium]|nr:DinB family protein [Gemmatimonadaceae bacterium]